MMEKKMTSGEIAKKTGVSQKAIRLYDEKGLLKPTEYSEGNYRLYDKEALLVLEKIIALKQIGFSLEEIHDNLAADKDVNITDALNRQLQIMEARKYEIEKAIASIKSVLLRQEGEPDWDNVAEIVKMMQKDQGADERHLEALKHHAAPEDWYVMIYKTLNLQADSKVLDLGCGFAKLWRNNWSTIPQGVVIDGYDLHGGWADDFEKFVEQNRGSLAECSAVNLYFEDVEEQETWKGINAKASYDCIIAHYLISFLKDVESFMERVSQVLASGGMFTTNGAGVSREHAFWVEMLQEMKLKTDFVVKKKEESQERLDVFLTLLQKYFPKVENITLDNVMRYEDAGELFERLVQKYPEGKKYLLEKEKVIKAYFTKKIEEQGAIMVPTSSDFQHCYNNKDKVTS